mmetsp:Transcript_29416/g.58333  ORF Transcript_29416/g.58333 Transcript_29416/m.58333 type:complete len:421 (-) Transcript_29416:234-1496(-)|eukprot:CAMPEP_0194313160 /NCGR_PEP_ID=MMETSP0171-20130528/10057_1 /TAXON_ID=218684 /ORGANISM="Corethron pennatum, Strain L29A3" /LENGTH=420 /DNA_ID=CAMNT_0039067995 /DNA_START=516 /DNA_END=1778 /DNA_ORIENTATION=-
MSTPVPVGLQRLAEQFSTADVHGVAPDLADAARSLGNAAQDGTLYPGIGKLTLADAVRRSTAELDAAAMFYMATVPAEISRCGVEFDASHFARDVVAAFANLKKLHFDGMRTVDYDNIQGALSKHETAWRSGPHKNEVFVIQHFCLRMVELTESLRQRTGARIANDTAAESGAPSAATAEEGRPPNGPPAPSLSHAPLSYEHAPRIVGGPEWPACVNGTHDWARLFGPSEDDGEDGPWLTPRMASSIHHIAVVDGGDMFAHDGLPRLPRVARPFYQKNVAWRRSFRDCYLRIALRLQKGLPPRPNCTGEEMALHNIMYRAPDADDCMGDEYEALPKHPNDRDFEMVKDMALEDEDVLMLFEENDDVDSDEDEPSVDNPVLGPGSLANFMLGTGGEMTRAAHLHPKEWFVAFRQEQLEDHL